jgi:guanine nucleotide-binding protein G(I)/G(S)/G(T) subunit beta-1
MSDPRTSKITAIKGEIDKVKKAIQELRKSKQNGGLSTLGARSDVTLQVNGSTRIKMRRDLNGHFGKVYSVDWSGDGKDVLSAAQDGKLILWDALSSHKLLSVPLRSTWVMTCSYEQTNANGSRLVACGGLDNVCSLYSLKDRENSERTRKPLQTLVGHDGYIASTKFIDARTVLTASGDHTVCKWDTESGKMITTFQGHEADVLSLSTNPKNVFTFISGSCDFTAKLWDIRVNKSVQSFEKCHTEDINAVSFFPSGDAFATGSDDGQVRIFELRCRNEVALMGVGSPQITSHVHAVGFSKSGRILFAGYDDSKCRGWDILKSAQPFCVLSDHETRVSSLAVNPSGDSLVTGSWDSTLKVFG